MDNLLEKLLRITAIAGLSIKETIRKKLLFFLLASCIIFIASGAGCTSACSGMSDNGMEMQYTEQKKQIQKMNSPDKKEILLQLENEYQAARKDSKDKLQKVLTVVVYSITCFWLFLIAAVFTPFTVMNDFNLRTHVMVLARPVSRWEYLLGKFSSIIFIMLLNLSIMLVFSGLFSYWSVGNPGFIVLKGILVFSQGLIVFTSMMLFFSLTIGRLPSVFLGLVLPWLTVIPAVNLINGEIPAALSAGSIFTYVFGYGLPQFSVNYFYALSFVIDDMDFLKNMHKIGNNTGLYSIFINTAWLVFFWILSIFVLKQKDIET